MSRGQSSRRDEIFCAIERGTQPGKKIEIENKAFRDNRTKSRETGRTRNDESMVPKSPVIFIYSRTFRVIRRRTAEKSSRLKRFIMDRGRSKRERNFGTISRKANHERASPIAWEPRRRKVHDDTNYSRNVTSRNIDTESVLSDAFAFDFPNSLGTRENYVSTLGG